MEMTQNVGFVLLVAAAFLGLCRVIIAAAGMVYVEREIKKADGLRLKS